jgi:hypothetical protein
LFGDLSPVEHAVYLGHDALLALSGPAEIRLFVALGAGGSGAKEPLEVAWEYSSEDGWLPLTLAYDKTEGFTQGGEVRLVKDAGPDALAIELAGKTSYWIRARLLTRLPPETNQGGGFAPTLDGIRLQVGFTRSALLPDAAAADTTALDVTRNFFPFGRTPVRYTTFYLASDEVFQRRGARVTLDVELSELGVVPDGESLDLRYEYWDGHRWKSLGDFDLVDTTEGFTKKGTISFWCPPRWAKTPVVAKSELWLRIRIAEGSYGHPLQVLPASDPSSSPVEVRASTLRPPVIQSIGLSYTYKTEQTDLDQCLTFNEFTFTDATDACRWPRRYFEPFVALNSSRAAFHFGFDQPLPVGLVSLYFSIPALESGADTTPFAWEYFGPSGWVELGVLDETAGFRRSGMIQFIGPSDALPLDGLGGSLYRIRARSKSGGTPESVPVRGAWLNAAWATNRFSVKLEPLGQSNGNPLQSFYAQKGRLPVLEGEVVEVREWAGSGAGFELAMRGVPEKDLRLEREPTTGAVRALWIRWHERPHLFDVAPDARVYVIERTTGRVRFGDSVRGAIPPAGARVVMSYSTSDALAGNVAAGAISELRAGIAYLKTFTNPDPAAGGAETEAARAVLRRGPERLRHRDRAITPRDYEWLAHEASAAVARVRCLAVTGPEGARQPGFVTLLLVPHAEDAEPQPTPELVRRVRAHVARRMPAAVAGRVVLLGPTYVRVGVKADIVPRRAEQAAEVEVRVLSRLVAFLHPLTGGPGGHGWDFGQAVSLSQVASLIETTEGVDYAPRVGLCAGDEIVDEWVPVGRQELVASGVHELKLTLGGRT